MSATIPLHKTVERSLRRMSPTGWALTLGWVLLVGSYTVAALAVHNGRGLTAFSCHVQCHATMFACGGLLINWRTTEKRTRVFGALLTLGGFAWLVAHVIWTYFSVDLRQTL